MRRPRDISEAGAVLFSHENIADPPADEHCPAVDTQGGCACEATRRSHPSISPRLPLPPSTHNVQRFYHNTMSSALNRTSAPSNFEALFDAALAKYTKCTGQDLRNHELARILDRCESPDSILAIFKEQSKAFDEFRNGDPKLIRWLAPVVNVLHAISTSAAISAGASLVSLTSALSHYQCPSTLSPRHSPLQNRFLLELVSSSPCVSLSPSPVA